MKLLLTTAAAIALVSLGGCNRGATANNAAYNTAGAPANNAAPAGTAGKPAGDANSAAAPADTAAPADAGGKPGGDATTTSSGDQPPPADQGTGGK